MEELGAKLVDVTRLCICLLKGVGDLSEQASTAKGLNQQGDAATKIQAAYRGHSVRTKLDWTLPAGGTLKDRIKGNVPQVRCMSETRIDQQQDLNPQSLFQMFSSICCAIGTLLVSWHAVLHTQLACVCHTATSHWTVNSELIRGMVKQN